MLAEILLNALLEQMSNSEGKVYTKSFMERMESIDKVIRDNTLELEPQKLQELHELILNANISAEQQGFYNGLKCAYVLHKYFTEENKEVEELFQNM